MLRSSCTSGLFLLILAAGCSLENPVADFGPDSGNTVDDAGADASVVTDVPPGTDIPSEMDTMTVGDSSQSDVQENDAESDAMSAEAGMDVPPPPEDAEVDAPPPPMDSGVDVPTPPVDTGVDASPMDTGVDVPPPPVDTGADVPVVVDSGAHDAGTVDVPPASCSVVDPCSSGQNCSNGLGGHCEPCGASNQICCPFLGCNSGLSCHWWDDGECH